jgi:hypothetical protein
MAMFGSLILQLKIEIDHFIRCPVPIFVSSYIRPSKSSALTCEATFAAGATGTALVCSDVSQ